MRQGDQGVRLEPLLEAISAFLDDQRDVIECIRRDLVRGLKQPGSGRHGLTATQVLRSAGSDAASTGQNLCAEVLVTFCAQSIEITWIAAIQSRRFATETS